ncbi:DUF4097 family beta strand repeat-containing protein [Streptomyces sp. NPDC057854]|uniref:DUF4097 family beta strand repeat-containing protein n=1 Tax=unclassified Streptomyces TaxID=2593676 RepID=UPI00369CF82C
MQTFATATPVTAVVDIPAGHLRFIAADRTDTTVDIRPATPGKNRDTKAAENTTVTYTDGILTITAPQPGNQLFGPSGAVEITVQLPAGSHVRAKTAAAELRGVGRLGDVTYESAQGPAKLDEAATAHLTLQDGDITIGRLNGPADLTTARGDLRVTEATTGTLTLTTHSGSITVGAARGTAATLDAGTTYGRVHNTLQNAKGTTADLTIHATTSHGDITAHAN